MHSKAANLPDRTVRYLESGGGRALILLHAFPLSADQWLPQLHRLPPGWRGVAPDLRGFRGPGLAFGSPNVEGTTMDAYAGDVLALMAHLEIDRAVIGGLSMGGYVAMAIARKAPQRVAGLVLANTRAGADSAEGLAARDRMIAMLERGGAAAIADEMLPKLLGATTRREQGDLEQVVRGLIEINSTDGLVAAVRAMKGRPDSTSSLASMGCPALVISGDEDAIIGPADTEALRAAMRGAVHVPLARAGHLTNLEAPNAFNDALSSFLTKESCR